jgi:hypothetical protein
MWRGVLAPVFYLRKRRGRPDTGDSLPKSLLSRFCGAKSLKLDPPPPTLIREGDIPALARP